MQLKNVKKELISQSSSGGLTLEKLSQMVEAGDVQELPLVVKADVQGSLEAVSEALVGIAHNEVSVKIIHKAVGGISENDVQLASASKAMIVAFNVRADARASKLAESEGTEIIYSRVIYELVDKVKSALEGLLAPEFKEKTLGRVEVRQTFRVPKLGLGCRFLCY